MTGIRTKADTAHAAANDSPVPVSRRTSLSENPLEMFAAEDRSLCSNRDVSAAVVKKVSVAAIDLSPGSV